MTTSCLARFILIMFAIVCCIYGCAKSSVDQNTLDRQLLAAVKSGDPAAVQQLLQKGARVGSRDERDETALDVATSQNEGVIIPLLLETKIDAASMNKAVFEAAGNQPAVFVVQTDAGTYHRDPRFISSTEVVRLLLDKGAAIEAVNEEYDTPLIHAAAHGGTGVVKLLLERGANTEARDGLGFTALNAAACLCAVIDMPDTLDIVRLLLERGANIETKDDQGDTPLMRASGWGRTEIVKLLLERRANIEGKNNDGNTALSISAEGGVMPTTDTVRVLLDRGSEIETRNKEGKTPLILAASGSGFERFPTVKLLLERGANVHARDIHGETALSLAKKNNQQDIQMDHDKLVRLLSNAASASR
jgi:ankyrin repeat protein